MAGWGRFTWGQAYWGEDQTLATGWGAKSWNSGEWGNLADETVSLSGLSITSNIGSVTISGDALVLPTGVESGFTLGSITNVVDVTVEPNGLLINDLQGTALVDVSVTPAFTGNSITSAIGVIDPADQVVGLTSQSITSQQGTAVSTNEDVSVTGQFYYI